MKIKIKVEHLAKRCEICHQDDLFNAEINICGRCEGVILRISSPSPVVHTREYRDYFFQPRFLAGIATPFILTGVLFIPVLIIRLFFLLGDLGEFFDFAYVFLVFCGIISVMMFAEILLFMTLIFIIKVMISDRWEG